MIGQLTVKESCKSVKQRIDTGHLDSEGGSKARSTKTTYIYASMKLTTALDYTLKLPQKISQSQ